MKKTITALSLAAALFAASTVPAASVTTAAPEPPAACADLVSDLAAKLKKAVASLVPTPDVAALTPLVGDVLAILTAMQDAGCLPAPPVSAPSVPAPVTAKTYEGPADQCVAAVLNLISSVAGLGGTVLGAAAGAQPDAAKLTELLKGVLKDAEDLLAKCGLPKPSGGMPAMSGAPLPVGQG
ncbi:hypothetical protein AB0A63_16820 [Lentzea sp. NPDC042327]|uniref:hypothetical protein n=1 Tax=Lentzea sp. NPDC042327 TaxID=3154801 RepID=UPI0033EA07DD